MFFPQSLPRRQRGSDAQGREPSPVLQTIHIQQFFPEENFDADEEVKIAQASSFARINGYPAPVSRGRISSFRG
jgi:hypothetical protein